ncbi:MAG: hypothetical protein N4A64_07015 [Marinisporobacter sp.]|jgi:hypothetical protein|nr:hypothetical protein [Marinisporobacter sp.]
MANIPWKTQKEIDKEKEQSKKPTEKERIEALEQALVNIMMEG